MRILFFIVILAIINGLSAIESFAQKQSTPLEAQAAPQQSEIGLLFGMGYNYQIGSYFPDCQTCEFKDGNKFGFNLGVLFERDFNENFQWGASIQYISKSLDASYIKFDTVAIGIEIGKYEDREIPFRNTGNFEISFLSLQPYLKWTPYPFVFARFGVSSSLVASANFLQNMELLKFKDTLKTGEIVDITMEGAKNNILEIENSEISGINSLQFSLEPAIGFNFEIDNQFYISPLFQYSIPLTKISNDQTDFNVGTWRFMIEFRLALVLRKFVEK